MLFPTRRAYIRQLHETCFRARGLGHRELDADELGGADFGWELAWGDLVRVHYLLGIDAPYGAPDVRIVQPAEARERWRHVELDGTVCLLPPGASWMPLLHPAAIDGALLALRRIIEVNARGSGEPPDAATARHRWLTASERVWSLLDLDDGDAREAVAARVNGRWVIAPTTGALDAWLDSRGLAAGTRAAALVVRVERFADVPTDLGSLDAAERQIAERGGVVVYVVPTDAGPLLVAVALDPSGALCRARVDRADWRWLHERGGRGLPERISRARVAVVGCGSLGAGVAELLVRAGIGRLTLIDHDTLSWDNVARHALGGPDVGSRKAVALAARLRAMLPTAPGVVGLPQRWQEVAAERPDALDADLVVSTMAAWPGDLALAEWLRPRGVPLVAGWLEPRAAAGHAVSLQGRCLACAFTPLGRFRRTVALWDEPPVRQADGCHEQFLPYGYAEVVPTQSLIARLALEVVSGESSDATHRALVPSPDVLRALGARPSPDAARRQRARPAAASWAEDRRDWSVNPSCWHCGGAR